MINELAVFTIDMVNTMILLYNSGKLSYSDFLKHTGLKVKFLRDYTDLIYIDNQNSIQSILIEYDRIVSSKVIHLH